MFRFSERGKKMFEQINQKKEFLDVNRPLPK
jgi:hypothetical protein